MNRYSKKQEFSIEDLSIDCIASLIDEFGHTISLSVIEKKSIPEADILKCLYKDIEIFIKKDLIYGFDIYLINENNYNVNTKIVDMIHCFVYNFYEYKISENFNYKPIQKILSQKP